MTTHQPPSHLDAPTHYRICALGIFSPAWLEMLSGEWIIAAEPPDQPETTILIGHVLDQAALLGVLEQIYSLGLPLLSIECLLPDVASGSGPSQSHHSRLFPK